MDCSVSISTKVVIVRKIKLKSTEKLLWNFCKKFQQVDK